MKKVFTGIFLLAFSLSIHSVYAQTVTVEQKAKIFWQGFVNSYKKNNKVNVDKFDPDGVKVDWPIAIYNNLYDSYDKFLPEIITSDDYHTQILDNTYVNLKLNYKSEVAKIFNGSSSIKVFKFDMLKNLFRFEGINDSFTNYFNNKYGDTNEIYVVSDYNSKNNQYNYFVSFLKYDGKKFKLAAIYNIEERGD
jgi:hypothetical protein